MTRFAARALAVACLAALAACHRSAPSPTPGSPADLVRVLQPLAGADAATRRHAVTGWILDEPAWRQIVVEPYRELWRDYAHAFDAALPGLVARLATPGTITARRHYAGDPRLTRSQGRLRWAVPVQYPSMVAELGGTPIDTVFVYDGTGWRVLAGLDEAVLAKVRALDPACADRLAKAGGPGRCSEVGWLVADAALRIAPAHPDRARFAHACQLATTLCGNETP